MYQYSIDIFSYSGPYGISSSEGKHNSGPGTQLTLCLLGNVACFSLSSVNFFFQN